MAVYERETRVHAPLEDVWAFHSTTDGLVALTPSWLDLTVESVSGPDGEANPEELGEGSVVELSVRPFGVGQRRHTKSVVERRQRDDGAALFQDRMVEGPFAEWIHTHAFYASNGDTIIRDRVEYELPHGPVGTVAARGMVAGLEPMFRHRHRRARELLEDRSLERRSLED